MEAETADVPEAAGEAETCVRIPPPVSWREMCESPSPAVVQARELDEKIKKNWCEREPDDEEPHDVAFYRNMDALLTGPAPRNGAVAQVRGKLYMYVDECGWLETLSCALSVQGNVVTSTIAPRPALAP